MKQLAFVVMIAAISVFCFAGIDDYYSFNATTGTYAPVTGTEISSILSDDALSEAIDIGFTFPYGENTFTQLMVSSNGWIGLGNTFTDSNLSNALSSLAFLPVLAPLWDDTNLVSGSASYLLSGTAPNRTFTIQYSNFLWDYSGTSQFNMQVKLFENGKISFIYGANTGAPTSPAASIGINMATGGANWFYSVSPDAVPSVSMTVENTNVAAFPASGTTYEFIPTVPAQNDLSVTSVSGNPTPSVGILSIYTVSVRNRGSNPQSTYQVKLVTSTGTELASVNGTTILPGAIQTFPLSWTPTAQGTLLLRGKVVLPGDQNQNNDLSNPISVTVMPHDMIVVTIGSGNQQAQIPVNMFWRNSLFETIYYPTEIGMVGNISALSFYNNFFTNLPNMPTKIWLGTTQQADLSAGWIPSAQLSLVYDGTVNYPSGQNTILIPLQTVFTYTGGNLVMMVNRPLDTQYYSSQDYFLCQTVGTTRSRNVYSDVTTYDPAAPPADAPNSGQFPKTSIHLTPLGTDPVTIISPNAVAFGQVLMNSSNTRQMSIMNGGAGTLTISSVLLSGNQFYSITNPPATPVSLVTGQSISLNLLYNPTAAGEHSGTITITDNLTRTVHTVPLTATCLDPTIYTLPYAQNFDDVIAPALPLQWQKIQQSTSTGSTIRTVNTNSFSEPNNVYLFNEFDQSATLILIAPPYANTIQTNTTKVHFRGRAESVGAQIIVGIISNPLDAQSFTPVQSLTLTGAWTEYVVSFASYTGAGKYVAFKHGVGGQYQPMFIDNVMLGVIPQTDLACTALTGNSTPSVGNATTYSASVFNWGTLTQSAYTVKLYNASNVELASAAGVSVAANQTVQVPLVWTPVTEGPAQLYAKVVITGDQNSLNDASPIVPITVMPAGLIVATIGTGTDLLRIPLDMYYKNSLFETIFFPQEIGVYGNITNIAFYNNFFTNLPNMPTKIWLGTTQQMDLAAGWIPSTQLTLVFNGNVNYPSGQNQIMITLPTPFTYAGGNLVLMVKRPLDTIFYSSTDRFVCSNGTALRSLNVWSDTDDYMPETPPPGTTATSAYPNTSLYMTPLSPDPIFSITPASRNFGTVLLNNTQSQVFSIMNAGGSPLTLNTIGITGSPFFSLQSLPTLPVTLATGQTSTFIARYNPTALGAHTATITVNDNLRISLGSREARSRTPHSVELSGTCIDPTITSLPYLQLFDAATIPDLPVQWSKIVQGTSVQSIETSSITSFSMPNSVRINNAADINSTLILVAPPYANTIATNTTRIHFRAVGATGNSISVGVMTNPQDPATFTLIQNVALTQTWAEYVVSFGGYTGTGKCVAFKHNQEAAYQTIFIDNVMLEVSPQNDLAALSVIGNTTPSVGIASDYTVSVYNWGSNIQSNYLVKLYRQGDIEIGSANGVTVNPNQTVNVSVGWTPAAEGATSIYAKTVLTGDQNNLNDASPSLNVIVYPAEMVVLTIGEGNETGRFPVDMYYKNSLFECLYYPPEISNTIGSITGIAFYNNFASNLLNMPTNVWMGTTTQADLTAGWIPSTQLTQVFSGTIDYLSGTNMIHIPFSSNFLYLNGQNLVLMVERPMDTQYYSYQDMFKTQSWAQLRSRNAYSDSNDFDPANPPEAIGFASFPKTSIFIIPGGVGHLNGIVSGAGNQPLSGVAIASTTGGYTATTDANGHYSIINIIAGTYQFSFSRYGYISQTITVVIPEDETIVQNVLLQQMPVVSVSGTILGSDTGAGLSGAGINLQGYDNYNASTNAQGVFSIPGVYANHSYNFTIIRPGYQNHSGSIAIAAENYSFGTITLNEVAYAPRHVLGEIIQNNTQVSISWQAPDPTALDVVEGFEGEVFPPATWDQVITNTGAEVSGVYPTWCRFNAIAINGQVVNPTEGVRQAGLWWSYDHQDEWLITPSFNCPPEAYLNFASYVFQGSNNGDHYYVKVSADNGDSWTVLWDASAQTGGWNYYASPIAIDLSIYEGMQLKLAWHADDPPTNDGIWYAWFIDDIYIGNAVTAVRFANAPQDSKVTGFASARSALAATVAPKSNIAYLSNSKSPFSTAIQPTAPVISIRNPGCQTRALTGYLIWRLLPGQEANPVSWTPLGTGVVTGLTFTDENWQNLPNGNYRWAVKAVYTSNVLSVPSFSNVLQKETITGFISGVVRNTQSQALAGAAITAATYSATTNSVGAYSMLLPIGVYNVTAAKTGYQTQTTEDITVTANQTSTVNFYLEAGSGLEDELAPITATALNGNYPNPFNPETTISFALNEPERVCITIYNLKGQIVQTLHNATLARGYHSLVWNGKDKFGNAVGSGVYYYRMQAGSYQSTRKMLLME